MRTAGLISFALLALLGLSWWLSPTEHQVWAQGGNLLTNPSFEGSYSSYIPETPQELADCPRNICTTAQLPSGWKPWWVKERPTDVNPEYKPAETNVGAGRIHSGSRAAQYFSFWSTHKAGLRQTVTVPANAVVQFTVFGQAWISEADNADVSDRSGTPNMRIGIDPTGGTNVYNPNIVWSEFQQPYDAYAPFAVQAQAQGDKVTVFTYSAPSVNPNSPEYGFKHNEVYWDDASLVASGGSVAPAVAPAPSGGGNSSNPAPAPAAPAQFVPGPTATPNAEGIIYAEVQPGDSIWALAARAGLTLDEILELNEFSQDTVLRPGDLVIVGRGAPPGEEAQIEADSVGGSSEAAPSAEEEDVEPQPESQTQTEAEAAPADDGQAAAVEQAVATGQDASTVSVCLTAYDDVSADGVQDAGEALRPAVAFTISDGQAVVSNYVTDGQSEPFCVDGLKAGSYRVTRSVLPNEVLTTAGDRAVSLSEGSSLNLEFGSYLTDETLTMINDQGESAVPAESEPVAESDPEADGSDGLLTAAVIGAAIVGVLLLLAVAAIIRNNRRANAS